MGVASTFAAHPLYQRPNHPSPAFVFPLPNGLANYQYILGFTAVTPIRMPAPALRLPPLVFIQAVSVYIVFVLAITARDVNDGEILV